MQCASSINQAAHTDNAMLYFRVVDDATVGDDGVINFCAVDFRSGQKPGPGENRRAHIEEIKLRQLRNQVQVRLEKVPDRSDVLPVSLKNIRENAVRLDGAGNDMLPEIRHGVVE